jgi:hypothetical protein
VAIGEPGEDVVGLHLFARHGAGGPG